MRREASRLWSSGRGAALTVPDLPTCFELKVKRLGLANSPERWADSAALRKFVKANRTRHYIPESLLQEFGLSTGYEGE